MFFNRQDRGTINNKAAQTEEQGRMVREQLGSWRQILDEDHILGPDKAGRLFGIKDAYATPGIPPELMELVADENLTNIDSLAATHLIFIPKVSWSELEKTAKSLGITINITHQNTARNSTFLREHNNQPVQPTWQLLGADFRPYGTDSSIVETTIPAEICKMLLFYAQQKTFEGTPCYNSTRVFTAVTNYHPMLPHHDERRFVIRLNKLNKKEITISILEDEFEFQNIAD